MNERRIILVWLGGAIALAIAIWPLLGLGRAVLCLVLWYGGAIAGAVAGILFNSKQDRFATISAVLSSPAIATAVALLPDGFEGERALYLCLILVGVLAAYPAVLLRVAFNIAAPD